MPKATPPAPRADNKPKPAGAPNHPEPTGPIPGDEVSAAIAFAAAAIKHFDDRSDLSTINGTEFLQMAEECGIMERTKYDPKAHEYLKEYCASRNIVKGDEVLALSEAGKAILAEAEKGRAEAEAAAAKKDAANGQSTQK